MNNQTLISTRKATFDGKEIVIVELTVAQIRQLLSKLENDEGTSILDELLETRVPAIAIAEASGISLEELEKHCPTMLEGLAKEVEQANPFFVGMIKRRTQMFEKLMQMQGKDTKALSHSLTETSAT